MTRLRLLTLQLALAGVLSSSVCAAQTDEEKTAARAAGKAAQQAFVEGDYERSIALFHKAESLVHAPTHLLFIARAHEKQGRLVLALEAYNKIVYEQLPENAPPAFVEAQVAAKQEADALEQRIPTLTLTLEGAEVTDFRLLVGKQERPGLAGVPQPVDPGSHSIQAVAPDAKSEQMTVTLAEGENKSLTLKMISLPPVVKNEATEAAAPTQGEPKRSRKAATLRTIGWVSLSVGVLSLVTGGTTMIASAGNRGKANNLCDDEDCEDDESDQIQRLEKLARTFQVPGYLGLGIGAAATGTGIALLVATKKKKPAEGSWDPAFHVGSVEVLPVVAPQGAGFIGRF